MTKRWLVDLGQKSDREEKQFPRENDTERRSRSTRTLSDSCLSSERKWAKKAKRKSAASSTKSSVAEKKKKRKSIGRKRNCSASSLSSAQKKSPTSSTSLPPPVSRQEGLPGAESNDAQESHRNKDTFSEFASPDAPTRGGTALKKVQKKKKLTSLSARTSSTFIQDTTPNSTVIEHNNSSPNLLTSPPCEEGKKKASVFTCLTKTLSSEFPDVSKFYRDHFLPGSNRLSYSLRSQERHRFWGTFPNPSSSIQKGSWGGSPTPRPVTSLSVFSAPTNLLNIGQKCNRGKPHLSLGGVASCNSFSGLTRVDLTSLSHSVIENLTRPFTSASPTNSNRSKELFNDAVNLKSPPKKVQDPKSNQQIEGSRKNGQPLLQYRTGQSSAPRIGNNFLLNFMPPCTQADRAQTMPASTQAVPSSSSFHGGPLESLQLMSENHQRTRRQQSQFVNGQRQQRKYLERQKSNMLKPLSVSKNQNSIAKIYDISTSEFSAAILPDPGTMPPRFTQDVSFDEGTRYRSADFLHGLKGKGDSRGQSGNYVNGQFGSAVSMRGGENLGASCLSRQDGKLRHGSNSNINLKDSVPLSLIRMGDRSDLPPATSPFSAPPSPAIAATTTTPSCVQSSPQRSAPSVPAVPSGSNIAFRFQKEKQNWNRRLGDLSVSGGGYSNQSPINSNPKQDTDDSVNPISMTCAVQRNLQTRERASAVATARSRLSMRYSSKVEEASFSDPCMSALPSFQQRLMDLSILEGETIKYEKNRKLRRKKNPDKDS